jgi:predicted DNA-binding transcriptional regulator AlpA
MPWISISKPYCENGLSMPTAWKKASRSSSSGCVLFFMSVIQWTQNRPPVSVDGNVSLHQIRAGCCGVMQLGAFIFWSSAMSTAQSGPRRMLNEAQVLQIIPVSRTTLFRMEKTGRFPKSTYISPNRRVWFQDEIVA